MLEKAADAWSARHGRFALSLARTRAIDAYLLGDLVEQERWSSIREIIEETEEAQRLSKTG
jgi:hypothetical protein